jgi:MFS family permease
MKLNREQTFYLVFCTFIFLMVVKKAIQMPISHDEVSTIDIAQRSIWQIVSYEDPIPNNHILNTLLLKLSMAIFGDHPLSDRLFNMLFFIPYAFFAVRLAYQLFSHSWVRATFVVMMSTHLFALDFFSVTRGYGIALALQVVSMYYLARWFMSRDVRTLSFGLGSAALGVMASFTLLNYLIPIVGLIGLMLISIKNDQRWKSVGALSGIMGLLGVASYLPITRMVATKQFTYWGSNGFVEDTYKPLLLATRFGAEYFSVSHNTIIIALSNAMAVLVICLLLFFRRLHNRPLALFMCAMLPVVILYNIAQFYILDVPFLNPRTALTFIPLTMVVLGYGIEAMHSYARTAGLALCIAVSALCVQHYVRAYNIKVTYEWYYDGETYDVIKAVTDFYDREKLNSPIKLNCHWIFHPSLNYHIKQLCPDKIILVDYHKDIQPESDATFYYTQSDEHEKLTPRFDIYQDYGWRSRFLMKHK